MSSPHAERDLEIVFKFLVEIYTKLGDDTDAAFAHAAARLEAVRPGACSTCSRGDGAILLPQHGHLPTLRAGFSGGRRRSSIASSRRLGLD